MSKIIRIANCWECVHYDYFSSGDISGYKCNRTGDIITNSLKLLQDCPLEDSENGWSVK